MRRQISLLLAVISTAIVVSFVIPLLLLVRTLAEDRGMAAASQQANTIAVLVSSLHDDPRLEAVLQPSLDRSITQTSVVLADGRVLGVAWPDVQSDPAYAQAIGGQAFSVRDDAGGRVYVPVLVDGGVVVVRASMTSAQLAEGVPLAWGGIIGLGVALSGIAVWVGGRVGRGISRPLLAVSDTAHRLRQGELAARAPLAGTEETIELGSALNGLADRIEELLAAERDNVRGLAHRLRTPVTALRLEAEQVSDPQIRAGLAESVVQLQTTIDEVVREAQRPLRAKTCRACVMPPRWFGRGSSTGVRSPRIKDVRCRRSFPTRSFGCRSAPWNWPMWSTSAWTTSSPTRPTRWVSGSNSASAPTRPPCWWPTTGPASRPSRGSSGAARPGWGWSWPGGSSNAPTAGSPGHRSAFPARRYWSNCRCAEPRWLSSSKPQPKFPNTGVPRGLDVLVSIQSKSLGLLPARGKT